MAKKDKKEGFIYPPAKKDDVADDFHGTSVADPYRWMEKVEESSVQDWVEVQNEIAYGFLREGDDFGKVKSRLTEIWNYEKYSPPRRRGERYFFFNNDGLQNQMVLYMKESLHGTPREVIDPNKWSEDGTSALENLAVSEDGKLLAYGRGEAGSDWQNIRVLDVDTGDEFEETLKWCRFAAISWKPDNSGFFYNRYPEAGSVPDEDRNNYSRVCFHKPGTKQEDDECVYEDPENKELDFHPQVTHDGKYLVINVTLGTDPKNKIHYKDIEEGGEIVKLLDEMDAQYEFIYNQGSRFFFKTDLDASRGRIISIDVTNPVKDNWTEIIPESADTIDSTTVVNGRLVVNYMHHAANILKIFGLDGGFEEEIELPAAGSVGAIHGKPDHEEMFFLFTSYLFPSTVFRFDFRARRLETFAKPEVDFDPDQFETKQVFYSSKDGTKIPMFITHKKGIELDGSNPTILYGYGGFSASLTPSFSAARLVWFEKGGVFALANLRGGSEYGEEWHQAGMLERKQNVFDDFIAAAQWLIDNNYTSPEKLAIEGGSNGGLLVAVTMLQRPDLFGAIVCRVPVIDMLRYHRWTIGRYWVPEYGDPGNPEHFPFMYAYSPLHNVKSGVDYPPILIMTADTDDRVWPAHSFKFAATLQEADKGNNPILLRVEKKAGHGHGKPTAKIIESAADVYAFLFKSLGVK